MVDDKQACGGGCPHQNPQAVDPVAEGIRVVWHMPTEYDLAKHGPPYMPKASRTATGVGKPPYFPSSRTYDRRAKSTTYSYDRRR